MTVNFSANAASLPLATLQSSPAAARSQFKPGDTELVDKIADEYRRLSPEEQRNARLYLAAELDSYQQKQQARQDVKRNVVLGVAAVNHRQNLLDTYYSSATGHPVKRNQSSGVVHQALVRIDNDVEQQQRVKQQLALAALYAKYGGRDDVQPEPYQRLNMEA